MSSGWATPSRQDSRRGQPGGLVGQGHGHRLACIRIRCTAPVARVTLESVSLPQGGKAAAGLGRSGGLPTQHPVPSSGQRPARRPWVRGGGAPGLCAPPRQRPVSSVVETSPECHCGPHFPVVLPPRLWVEVTVTVAACPLSSLAVHPDGCLPGGQLAHRRGALQGEPTLSTPGPRVPRRPRRKVTQASHPVRCPVRAEPGQPSASGGQPPAWQGGARAQPRGAPSPPQLPTPMGSSPRGLAEAPRVCLRCPP